MEKWNVEYMKSWTPKVWCLRNICCAKSMRRSTGTSSTIAEDINVRKGNMHCHGAELASVGIVVEGISDFMTTVAATLAEPVNQGYLDFGFSHSITP